MHIEHEIKKAYEEFLLEIDTDVHNFSKILSNGDEIDFSYNVKNDCVNISRGPRNTNNDDSCRPQFYHLNATQSQLESISKEENLVFQKDESELIEIIDETNDKKIIVLNGTLIVPKDMKYSEYVGKLMTLYNRRNNF